MERVRALLALPVVSPAEALAAPGRTVVDLRSPAEYADDHLPGAVGVPLFDDLERALIGTLYARRSREEAFAAGVESTRRGIDRLVRDVARAAGWQPPAADLAERVERLCSAGIDALEDGLRPRRAPAPERPVVLYCWRGGLRSRSVLALLRELGLERAVGLEGGYKAYRRHVLDGLAAWRPPESFVLRGLTGVGKTLVLRALEELRPGWTLDLEALAGHRSSILGMVGLEPCSQKAFDSRLLERLRRGFPGPCVVEGESRKVGDVVLAPRVWEAVDTGAGIELTAQLERRVDVLVEDYLAREENRVELARRLPFIEERLGSRRFAGVLVGLLEAGRERELVELLLERYYDPLYRHSERGRRYAVAVDATRPVEAAERVAEWVEAQAGVPSARKRETSGKNASGRSSHGM